MKNIYRWDNLTRPEIEKLVQKDAIVIIPTGSTEQHGLHLMVGSDALISTALSERVAEVLDKEYGMPAVVAPTLSVTNSIHHMSFPGTITLRPETYMQMLLEYCECLAHHGFKKIVMLNGHGGNINPTETAIININEKLGFPVYFNDYCWGSEKDMDEILETQKGGLHAGEMENSLALYFFPDLVDPCYKEQKTGNYTKETVEPSAPYTFHRMEEMTPTGALGNTYASSPEKGERLAKAMVRNMAKMFSELW